MITFADFKTIDEEVKQAVNEALDYLKTKSMYYVLYLANGDYKASLLDSHLKLNPNVIDSREDTYKDKDRRKFLVDFMDTLYSFPNGQATEDNESRLHMELMIYTHIWESKPFLKQLYRFSLLCQGKTYPWEIDIPDMSKHSLIREQVRNPLKDRGLTIANVIEKGFHTSLRNAFAHSEYSFNEHSRKIILYTYSGKNWDFPEITYDDWSKRFLYSVLIAYHYQNSLYERRSSIIAVFGKNRFVINLPMSLNRIRAVYIKYDPIFDTFNFDS